MKAFINKRVTFWMANVPSPVAGVVVGDRKDRVLLKGEDGNVTRILKSHVVMFIPDEEPEAFEPVLVLHCENASINCPGVYFALDKPGFNQADFDVFMGQCPARCESCRRGSLGDIGGLPRKTLKNMVAKTIFGDYPEKGRTKE